MNIFVRNVAYGVTDEAAQASLPEPLGLLRHPRMDVSIMRKRSKSTNRTRSLKLPHGVSMFSGAMTGASTPSLLQNS